VDAADDLLFDVGGAAGAGEDEGVAIREEGPGVARVGDDGGGVDFDDDAGGGEERAAVGLGAGEDDGAGARYGASGAKDPGALPGIGGRVEDGDAEGGGALPEEVDGVHSTSGHGGLRLLDVGQGYDRGRVDGVEVVGVARGRGRGDAAGLGEGEEDGGGAGEGFMVAVEGRGCALEDGGGEFGFAARPFEEGSRGRGCGRGGERGHRRGAVMSSCLQMERTILSGISLCRGMAETRLLAGFQ